MFQIFRLLNFFGVDVFFFLKYPDKMEMKDFKSSFICFFQSMCVCVFFFLLLNNSNNASRKLSKA
jgi:hypothetical protein